MHRSHRKRDFIRFRPLTPFRKYYYYYYYQLCWARKTSSVPFYLPPTDTPRASLFAPEQRGNYSSAPQLNSDQQCLANVIRSFNLSYIVVVVVASRPPPSNDTVASYGRLLNEILNFSSLANSRDKAIALQRHADPIDR